MGERRPTLVLLTDAFPYGVNGETFLETEIEVLADRFERIYVLPSHPKEGVRTLPSNVELVEMEWTTQPSGGQKWRALATLDAARVVACTARRNRDSRFIQDPKLYLDNLARNVLKARALARLVAERGLRDAVFYDYWLENSALALALLRRKGIVRAAVTRAHNFDIYEEVWGGKPVPFQDFKGYALDAVFPISRDGAVYIEQHIPSLRGKLSIHYLGVREPSTIPPASSDGPPLIVSCANLHPGKRVHLIPEVLEQLDRPLRWLHIGDGPERARVEAAASRLGPHVDWELRGQLDNGDVLRFYESQHVDAFLSVSISEGLPVSIMEAQSFGIPVIACAVHGIPEIVNETTGVLVDDGADTGRIADGVRRSLEPGRFDRDAIRAFFAANFSARLNYNRFADALISLAEDQAAAA